jgi:hypothetical protein
VAECFFCGKDEKLTRAHLFQRAFRDVLGTGDGQTRLGSASVAIKGVQREITYGSDIRQTKVTALCGDCNGRWMNRIEVAAAPAFATIVRDHGLPQAKELLKLAHWSVVISVLSSELHPGLGIPRSLRREVRHAPCLPRGYATYFVWTGQDLRSIQMDLFRVVDEKSDGESGVHWYHLLHAGPMVAISCSPDLFARVPRAFAEAGIHSVLGCLGETVIYIPHQFKEAMSAGDFPTHQAVHDLSPGIVAGGRSFSATANEMDLLDLSGGLIFSRTDSSFDFSGMLFDYRDLPSTAVDDRR